MAKGGSRGEERGVVLIGVFYQFFFYFLFFYIFFFKILLDFGDSHWRFREFLGGGF